MYKIAMIGLGSIGKRHLLNIDLVLKQKDIEYTIDLIRRKDSLEMDDVYKELITNTYSDDEEIPNDYDILFITNPTNMHYDTIKKYSGKTKNMFIEKPIFDSISVELSNLSLKEDGVYYVACPLRYTHVIQYVKQNIDLNQVYSARAICSSYLPDWRSGVDYRNTYSAHKEQGGGVSIDLIHEWDYLIYLFGKPNKINNFRGQFSHLEINSDDLSVYIAEYESKLVEVHLDYFGRETIRELQLFTKDDTIIVDIAKSEIRYLRSGEKLEFTQERNGYQLLEIENFFDILEGNKDNDNDISTALTTLKIAKDGNLS